MEHLRLKPIKGASGREKTAFTMKTISELLAEEGSAATQTPMMRSSSIEPETQQAPDQPCEDPVAAEPEPVNNTAPAIEEMRTAPLAQKASALPPITPVAEASAKKPRSLLGRLIGS